MHCRLSKAAAAREVRALGVNCPERRVGGSRRWKRVAGAVSESAVVAAWAPKWREASKVVIAQPRHGLAASAGPPPAT